MRLIIVEIGTHACGQIDSDKWFELSHPSGDAADIDVDGIRCYHVNDVIPILPDHAAFASGSGSAVMAALIQSQPQRRRTRGGSASSCSRKVWTSATLSSSVA